MLRRGIPGTFAFSHFWIKRQAEALASPKNSEIDKDGVIFCTYDRPEFFEGYNHEGTSINFAAALENSGRADVSKNEIDKIKNID